MFTSEQMRAGSSEYDANDRDMCWDFWLAEKLYAKGVRDALKKTRLLAVKRDDCRAVPLLWDIEDQLLNQADEGKQ